MPDLERRLRVLDRIEPPDLWGDIRTRETSRLPEPQPANRWVSMAVAIAMTAAAAAVLVPLWLLSPLGRPTSSPSGPAASTSRSWVPGVAVVVCDLRGDEVTTRVLRPVVRARPDGVHLRVDNRSSIGLELRIEDRRGVQGGAAPVGVQDAVRDIPPGDARAGCVVPGAPPYTPLPTLRVLDPAGLWVSPELECSGGLRSEVIRDYASETPGEEGTAIEVAARHLPLPLQPGDEVRDVGYPMTQSRRHLPVVAVVRSGRTVARVILTPASDGGWLVTQWEACSNEGEFEGPR